MGNDGRLQELLDKQALHELVSRLARAVDRCDKEMILSCYHPDGYDDHGPFKGTPEEFADWVVPASHWARYYHFVGAELFEIDGDVAFGDVYVSVYLDEVTLAPYQPGFDPENPPPPTGRMLTMAGRYLDRYERRDGEWRIAKRIAVLDWCWDPQFHEVYGGAVGTKDRSDPMYSMRSSLAG